MMRASVRHYVYVTWRYFVYSFLHTYVRMQFVIVYEFPVYELTRKQSVSLN